MLRLQQLEHLLKALVATTNIEGPPSELQELRTRQLEATSTSTLGKLVRQFTDTYFSPLSSTVKAGASDIYSGINAGQVGWYCTRTEISMPVERREQVMIELAQLVELRNALAHHFVEKFDMSDERGVLAAIEYLDCAYEQIEAQCRTLHAWAVGLAEMASQNATFMKSKAFEDMILHGINPDGSVSWGRSTIVECLRSAEEACQVDGWTSLDTAITHVARASKEQVPSRYGCRTWRQVLDRSRLFEWRSVVSTEAKSKVWYRSCVEPADRADLGPKQRRERGTTSRKA